MHRLFPCPRHESCVYSHGTRQGSRCRVAGGVRRARPRAWAHRSATSIAARTQELTMKGSSMTAQEKASARAGAADGNRTARRAAERVPPQLATPTDLAQDAVDQIGATTIRSISHISEAQTIEDDDDAFVPPQEMIRRLLADNRHMAEQQRAAIDLTEQLRDTPTSNLLQELLDETERRIWFLFEVSQGGENSA